MKIFDILGNRKLEKIPCISGNRNAKKILFFIS